jgi:CspA family cold shock protein
LFLLFCAPRGFFQDKQSNSKPRDDRAVRKTRAALETLKMATGKVKFFNGQKGFGFIQPDEGGPDVFVHISALERAGIGNLVEGQKVKFEVITDRGKKAASNLETV